MSQIAAIVAAIVFVFVMAAWAIGKTVSAGRKWEDQ